MTYLPVWHAVSLAVACKLSQHVRSSSLTRDGTKCSLSHWTTREVPTAIFFLKAFLSLKKFLLGPVKMIVNFIKSQLSNTCILKIVCDEMRSTHKECVWLLLGWTSCFFHGTPFQVKERLTDQLWLCSLEYFTNIYFSKMNKASCHFK